MPACIFDTRECHIGQITVHVFLATTSFDLRFILTSAYFDLFRSGQKSVENAVRTAFLEKAPTSERTTFLRGSE